MGSIWKDGKEWAGEREGRREEERERNAIEHSTEERKLEQMCVGGDRTSNNLAIQI